MALGSDDSGISQAREVAAVTMRTREGGGEGGDASEEVAVDGGEERTARE